ncbi:hypothetical protein [Halomonas sp. GD1P12]|uniref:hypothetical protein n=1 Tax=Halomonas sp. GD1P12 TaxID=2982691 RepID=UPI0021E3B16F|nr:hypothetical protein [Halomonas sp. GD1P12]UYG01265.1 hypothetical protein OCT39_06860 [Halomonas sp. GD1P12]
MKTILAQQFRHFARSDFIPNESLKEAFFIFFIWAFPAFLFVIWANAFYSEVEFYQAAISEGLGPNLWNVIGSFGLFAFGVALMFSKFSIPALIAKQILSNTYAIGCLTFGLLVGQWSVLLPIEGMVWWQRGLFNITSGFLLIVVFLYNLAIWYLSFLIQKESGKKSDFLIKLGHMHWVWRFAMGLCIVLLITLLFIPET